MSDSWERCPDCQNMIRRYGFVNLKKCEMCTHLYNDEIRCACESEEERLGYVRRKL